MEIVDGDRTLHVEVDGDADAPPVLLLHGITSSVRTWTWLVPRLTDRYRVLRLDFRGHGRSSRTPGEYQPLGYVADAAAACRQVAGVPCAVIGHSLGGGTAAALAQHHPELVRGALLEDPPIGVARSIDGNSLLDGFRLLRESVPRLQTEGIPVDVLAGILSRAPSAVGTPFGELVHPDALDAMAAGMLELDASVLDPVLQGTIRPAFDPARPIDVPVLVMTADPTSSDAVARPEDAARVLAASPLAELRVMHGAGHLIHDELAHREAFATIALEFLDRLP